MVDPRCPSCSARVPADADWCGLCYASLRVQPAPAQFVGQPARAYASTADFDPLSAPASALAELSELAAEAPMPATTGRYARRQAAAQAAAQSTLRLAPPSDPATATWPCRKCSAQVPLDHANCPVCGGGFLDSAEVQLRLPLIGNPADLEGGKKAMVMVGGAFAIIVAFLAIATLIGQVF